MTAHWTMTTIVSFFCQGEPVAQPRVRVVRVGKCVRMGGANKSHAIHRWKDYLRHDAQKAMLGLTLAEGPIALELTFLMPRPTSMPRKSAGLLIPHTKRPDLDNLEKAVKDALNTIVWRDDSQVSNVAKRKRYVRGAEAPGVHVRVMVDAYPDLPFSDEA